MDSGAEEAQRLRLHCEIRTAHPATLRRLAAPTCSTANQPTQPDVRINANRHARYDTVAKVLAAAQRNGIQRLGFVGQERFAE